MRPLLVRNPTNGGIRREARAGSLIGIVGLGALGTSIGLALGAAGRKTIGFDLSDRHIRQALDLGAVCTACYYLEDLEGCDVVFVSVPPSQVISVATCLLDATGATVIDVASVKGTIADALAHPRFVPSHPLRGTHLSGPAGGRKDLFVDGVWAVCPTHSTSPDCLRLAEALIQTMGAHPLRLGAAEHDSVTARTSHLPHVAASSLVHVLASTNSLLAGRLIGRAFAETTRVARANPGLWADITLQNGPELSESISAMIGRLRSVKAAIEREDKEALLKFFRDANGLIEQLVPNDLRGHPPMPPPAAGTSQPPDEGGRSYVRQLGGVH